jgi:dolichol-phosphate mannosyltransferase
MLDDRRIDLWQDWLDRYGLEPDLPFQALRCGFRAREIPVTIAYPNDKLQYTKMRAVIDGWAIFRPVVFLRLGVRR